MSASEAVQELDDAVDSLFCTANLLRTTAPKRAEEAKRLADQAIALRAAIKAGAS